MNVVFHGSEPFAYGHYGIHLGQQDRLTFLGAPNQEIQGHFLDCRMTSPTARRKLVVRFNPSSEWELNIPPGVAHSFSGLENVATLNNYDLYLPNPDAWLDKTTKWDMDADVINVELDADPASVELFEENTNTASEIYYSIVSDRQREAIPKLSYSYPYTTDFQSGDGTVYTLKVAEKAARAVMPDWEPIGEIEGLGWRGNAFLPSGTHSGFVPLLDGRPYYIVDHGFDAEYTHDAYGIHLGQEDRLMFLGDAARVATVVFVDCREDSATLHQQCSIQFSPDARRTLIIPNGVAHRFEHLEGIFTLNQGVIFLSESEEYQPGNDVIDWPASRVHFPTFRFNTIEASKSYYWDLARSQREQLDNGLSASTPVVVMAKDSDGNDVRVAIRETIPVDGSPAEG
ncbi:dTDP-4-dehydrorhamnose 3,5-epimerase family protein [Rhizobium sp. ZK1]|uniref:dTDP-4-dehydrorhamnose 3,5-epimerase family protein n=1 Tax=Rhizobium sp. ZK1 TaxID=3389872 RepID=UPI0039F65807